MSIQKTLLTKSFAAQNASTPLAPFSFERREPGPKDVLIEIKYCGVCHSDIHQVRNEWGRSLYPMVPGHEIVGKITRIGSEVKKFKVGELAGVGCFVDSCRKCPSCEEGVEQYCEVHTIHLNKIKKQKTLVDTQLKSLLMKTTF